MARVDAGLGGAFCRLLSLLFANSLLAISGRSSEPSCLDGAEAREGWNVAARVRATSNPSSHRVRATTGLAGSTFFLVSRSFWLGVWSWPAVRVWPCARLRQGS